MRAGKFLACAALSALSGCDRVEEDLTKRARDMASGPPASTSAASASASAVARDAGPRFVPLDLKARRAMRLSPSKRHVPGVAIGKGRVAVLTSDGLVVRGSTKFEEVARVALHEPRSLAVMADGSFLAADDAHTAWLLPQDIKARTFPKILMLPESALFADRGAPDRFWVLPGFGKTLYGYGLSASTVGMLIANAWVELDGFDSHALGSLRDGSFLYTTSSAFRRFFGPVKKLDVAGDTHDVVRILPGSRPDTVWVVTPERVGLYRLLGDKLVRLRSIELEAMPYDVEADGAYLAALELSQPSDAPWRFVLEVFDVDGKRSLHEALPAEESLDPKTWLSTLTRNRRLSLAADPPLVAVGGPDTLTVWRADKGTRLTPNP